MERNSMKVGIKTDKAGVLDSRLHGNDGSPWLRGYFGSYY